MITLVPRADMTDYERKYIYMEAPGDDAPRRNVRRITLTDDGVSVNGRDPTPAEDVDLDRDTEEPGGDDLTGGGDVDIEVDDEDFDNDEDIDLDDEDDLGDPEEGGGEEDVATEPGDDTGGDAGGEDTGEDPDVAVEPDDGGEGEDNPDGEGDGTDDENDAEGDNPPEQDNGETVRKRALFERFRVLYEAIDKYIEKMNLLMAYSTEFSKSYRDICDNMDELKNYVYDYMLVKLPEASYAESMLFYQRSLTTTGLILEKLEKSPLFDDGDPARDKKHKSKTEKDKGTRKPK